MAQKLTQIEESKNLKYTPQNLTDEEKEIARENIGANGGASGSSPIGAIIPFGGENVPAGFLLCDGEEYSKEDYKDLYAVIGDYFTKETVTAGYFNVPDLRARVAQGAEDNLGESIEAELPNVKGEHVVDAGNGVYHLAENDLKGAFTLGAPYSNVIAAFRSGYQSYKTNFSLADGQTNADGTTYVSQADSVYKDGGKVQPPAVAVNYIIKATSTREDLDEIIDDTSHDVGHALSAAEVDRRIEAPNTYSTEEVRVGTWIDGKPIYRRCFKANLNNNSILATDVETITNIHGQVITGSLKVSIPYGSPSNYCTVVSSTQNTNAVIYTNYGNNLLYNLVIEYTKTTD